MRKRERTRQQIIDAAIKVIAENEEKLWDWWWYLNDNKMKEGHYLDGEKNGIWTWWYDSGIKQSEGSYVDDEMDGAWFYYNLDGSIAEEKGFAEGQLNGKTTIWVTPEKKQSEKRSEKIPSWSRLGAMLSHFGSPLGVIFIEKTFIFKAFRENSRFSKNSVSRAVLSPT